jgi:cell division control protein 6
VGIVFFLMDKKHKSKAAAYSCSMYSYGSYSSVFKDESKLDINYVPSSLPHREKQLNLLNQFFRFTVETPGKMTQRVLITGRVGVGKTVLAQHFGQEITRTARAKGINLHYVHVNCRECKGNFFMILQRIILQFCPNFPRRGYSAEELLQALVQVFNEQKAYVILTLDELDALIRAEGTDPLYSLTRVHEDHKTAVQRLSLIGIMRDVSLLNTLDPSTRSTLQHNLIQLGEYTKTELLDILNDRVTQAFNEDAIAAQTLNLIVENTAEGDARYAIELLWRSGKYADVDNSREVLPEHVRKASQSVYPVVQKDSISALSLHEKLFLLGLTRSFRLSGAAYLSMGEAENAYAVVCEEFGQEKRGHTQLWKYVQELSALEVVKTEPSSVGQRGKTTLISLPSVSAAELEQELTRLLAC